MKIRPMNVAIGAGAGILDELGEKFDSDRGNTDSFTGITDWARVGVGAAAYAAQMMNFQPDVSEAVAQSVLPLATKTIVKSIMQATSGVAARPRVSRVASPSGGKVSWKPVPIH